MTTHALQTWLDQIKTSLTTALPGRIVTDSYLDHVSRDLADLQKGVVTILAGSVDLESEWVDQLHIKIIGQIAVDEATQTAGDVQRAELLLYRQIRAWASNPGSDIAKPWVKRAQFSRQSEYPYGWIVVEMEPQSVDLSGDAEDLIYPPTVTAPTPFTAANLGFDIEPHANAESVAEWIAADGQGDAADQINLMELPQ